MFAFKFESHDIFIKKRVILLAQYEQIKDPFSNSEAIGSPNSTFKFSNEQGSDVSNRKMPSKAFYIIIIAEIPRSI